MFEPCSDAANRRGAFGALSARCRRGQTSSDVSQHSRAHAAMLQTSQPCGQLGWRAQHASMQQQAANAFCQKPPRSSLLRPAWRRARARLRMRRVRRWSLDTRKRSRHTKGCVFVFLFLQMASICQSGKALKVGGDL